MPTSPSSLTDLRQSLKNLNGELFKLFTQRRETVQAIQRLKTIPRDAHQAFDQAREQALFAQMSSELVALGPKELLAFSLLMEAHAGAPEHYPAWSEGVHLLEQPVKDFHRTNPLLLKLVSPKEFQALRLRPNFAFLHDS